MPENDKIQLPKGFKLDQPVGAPNVKLPKGFTLDTEEVVKKKVGGAESSLTELSSKGFSPEQISLLQTGAQPPKPVGKTGGTTIIPTNLTPDQKDYERELKRQDAAINTLKNIYSQKGLKFDEKSKRGQEQVLGLLEKEKNNDLTLVTGKDQKPYLVRGEGFLESAGKGILRSITEPIESTKINFTNDPNELADLLDEKIKEEPNVPESAPTKFGGYLGGLAGGLPKMMALLAIPVAGESAMVGEMYHNALANQRRALYERGLQEGMDRPTAAMNAMKNAPITAIPDAIVGAAMARGIGGKAAGAEIIPNAAKESFLKATGNGLKGVAKVSGIGGAAEYGRSKVEQQLGYKVTDAEAIENGLRGMGEYAIMDAAFKLAHAGPKYLSSAAKNLLSTVPKEVLEVAAEKYPDGKQTLEDVAKFSETKAKVQDFVPEEKVGAIAGLTEKTDNLKSDIKILEEKKKEVPPAVASQIDAEIADKNKEVKFYDNQIKKVIESKDVTGIEEEIDDITGLKASEKPVVQEEAIVTEKVKPTEEKITATEFFNRPVNGKIYKTNKTSAESNWGIKSVNGEYIVDEAVGNNADIIKRPESLVKPLFDEANVSSPDDKIFVTKPAKLRKNADGTFDVVEKGEIYYGKEAPKAEVKPTEISPLNAIEGLKGQQENIRTEDSRKIINAVRHIEGLEPYTGPLDGLYSALKEADEYHSYEIFKKLNDLEKAVKEVKNLPSYKGFLAEQSKQEVKPTEVKETIKTTENAIQEPSAGRVLQPAQERVGETRGERKRVEPSVKREKVTEEGKQAQINEKEQVTQDDIKKAEAKLAAAKDKFEKAKNKIEATQVKQTGLFGGEQKGMFAMGGEEAKSTLDPLRKAAKEAKAELDDLRNRVKVQEQAQPELTPVSTEEVGVYGSRDLSSKVYNAKDLKSNPKILEEDSNYYTSTYPKSFASLFTDMFSLKNNGLENAKIGDVINIFKKDYVVGGFIENKKNPDKTSVKLIRVDKDGNLLREQDLKKESKKTYQEALKEKQEAEKKQTRQVAGEKAAASRKIFEKVYKMDAPEDAEQVALRYLADGGKVSKEAVDEAYGSVKRAQLNVKRRELLSEEVKSKDFVGGKETLDEVAHRLWEENGQRISERDIKEALMAEIGNNNTRLEAAEAYLDKYSPEYQLEKEEMRLAEQYKEQYLEEQEEVEKELRKPLEEQIEGLGSEEHINNLIEQYEAEIKGEDQQLRSESEGKISAEAGKGEVVKEAPKGEEKLAQEYKEVIKKASKKAKENAKKDFVDRNFDKIVEKLKIQIKCPT